MKSIISLLIVAICCSGTIVSAKKQQVVKVVLLGGQSNMAGRGVYNNLLTKDKKAIENVRNRVFVCSQSGPALPLGYAKQNKLVNEFGPELFIGVELANAYPDSEFLLIKRAVGGTSLHGAWSPDWTKEKAMASERGEQRQKLQLYKEHIQLIHQNLDSLTERGIEYEIIGMAWMQGEKDTRLALSATQYHVNLERLVEAYRAEMNSPKLPFVCGQINNPERGSKDYQNGPTEVRTAIEEVCSSVANMDYIPTSTEASWLDFPKREDNVHYNAEGQKRLGTAMAKKLLNLN